MKSIRLLLLTFFLMIMPVISNAQDEGVLRNNEFGLSFFTGFPLMIDEGASSFRTIGVNAIYHPVSFIAIEPGVYFTSSKEDEKNKITNRVVTNEDDSVYYGAGLYYYHNLTNNLYIYIGPRLEIMERESKEKTNYDSSREKTETNGKNYFLVLGLKYMINDNIGIFGDFNYGYGKSERTEKDWNSTGTLTSEYFTETESYSLMSSFVGVTFYF